MSSRGTAGDIEAQLRVNFSLTPTPSQDRMLYVLGRFLGSSMPNSALIIKGYAGTGKTTSVNALVKTLEQQGVGYELLAPTGRAAKVLGSYTSRRAFTIHKRIYRTGRGESGEFVFMRAENKRKNTVFVVDEASMIGVGDRVGRGGSLLDDLFQFVFEGPGCRLLLIGDDAQLPPVGSDLGPALNLAYLQGRYHVTGAMTELTDVTRQGFDSGILALATTVRSALSERNLRDALPFVVPAQTDVEMVSGEELQEKLEDAFADAGVEGAILVTRSNKRANMFNKQIRARVFYREEEIEGGDLLMSVKNNYAWLDPGSRAGFIANGDVMEVMRIGRREEVFGFRFAYATVRLVDYPDEPEVETVLWLDTLDAPGPSMPDEATERLYRGTLATYNDLPTKTAVRTAMSKDPFYNALQVKFAHAVTCHKAQGGQWRHVFVDQGYIADEMLTGEYVRWLYTAVTRATERLYLVNFSPDLMVPHEG